MVSVGPIWTVGPTFSIDNVLGRASMCKGKNNMHKRFGRWRFVRSNPGTCVDVDGTVFAVHFMPLHI